MKPLFFDVETTGATNESYGHPFDPRNKLCMLGFRASDVVHLVPIEMGDLPVGKGLADFNSRGKEFCFVGFNIKFDLHWIRRYGLNLPTQIWDCQYAQYCIWRQERTYPSLDQALEYWGFPKKLDKVKTEYWDKGIDTDQVPLPMLEEYLAGDLERTQWVYEAQLNYLADKPELYKLIVLGNEDILVTQEMEWNGFYYDNETSIEKGKAIEREISEIDHELSSFVPNVPTDWNSNDFVSAVLYGGVVKESYRESYERVLKSGEVKPKERWSIREHQLPALVKPVKGSELAKEGFYSTNEDSLRKLKGNKKVQRIIELLLHRAKIEKLMSTYYFGFPKLYEKKCWENNFYHPNLNHVVARTGRLSSTTPNGQNIPDMIRKLMVSRYHGNTFNNETK